MSTDVTTEILRQIRGDIRDLRDSLEGRIDGVDARLGVVEYAMRGMATDMHAIARLLRRVADEVADHGARLDELERQ